MTAVLDAILAEVVDGKGPDGVLLMRLLSEAGSEAAARDAVARAAASADSVGFARLERLQSLWTAHPLAWGLIRSVLDGVVHEAQGAAPDDALRSWAAVFDRLAAAAPEAGVALYSLGSPELLAAATHEIVALMDGLGLLAPSRDALDLGCGIGRLVVALASRMRSVVGADIAAGMVAEARRRCAALPNVRLLQGSGRDLGFLPDSSLDLVLAADVFPYLVQVGGDLPARHVEEFARVLRPGGAALILNYSYRGDLEVDRGDIARQAARANLSVERNGSRDLALWDAATFLLRKAASVNP